MNARISVPYRFNPASLAGFSSPTTNTIANKGISLGAGAAGTAAGTAAAAGVASAIGAGAAAGSVVPVVGTIIGAAVGLLAGSLIHTGQGPQRQAEATRVVGLLNNLNSAVGVGRQLPWSDTKNGLFQYLEDTMLAGKFMGDWAGSNFTTSPTNLGNWATTYMNGVKQILSAMASNPVGATISLDINNSPGGRNTRPGPFVFKNPGLAIGPDAIAAQVLMPYAGYAINKTGETPAHAQSTMASVPAKKVFALMADRWIAENPPRAATPAAQVSPTVVNNPAGAVIYKPIASANPIASVQPVTVTGTTSIGTPIVPLDQTAQLMAQLQAQGLSQQQAMQAAMASLQAQGVQATPQVQQQLQADSQAGIGNIPTSVWAIAAGLAAISFALARPVGKKTRSTLR